MVDILHRVGITASRDAVYQALTTPDGLAAWWTTDTRGDGTSGGVLDRGPARALGTATLGGRPGSPPATVT